MRSSTISRPDPIAVRPGGVPGQSRLLTALATIVSIGTIALLVLRPTPFDTTQTSTGALFLLLSTSATAVVVAAMARRPGAPSGALWLAIGLAVASASQLTAALVATLGHHRLDGNGFSLAMAALVVVALGSLAYDFFAHVASPRAELLADVGLVAILAGGAVYLLLHDQPLGAGGGWGLVPPAIIATTAVMLAAGAAVLTLWNLSFLHMISLAFRVLLACSAIALEYAGRVNWPRSTFAWAEVTAGVAVLGLGALFVMMPALDRKEVAQGPRVRWIHPFLLALSFCWMSIFFVVATLSRDVKLTGLEAVLVSVIVMGAVGVRATMMQLAAITSARKLERALSERVSALVSLQSAMDILAASEGRLRLLLDSAVDGVVELDDTGTIVRANGAFCGMVRLPMSRVIGKKWSEVASAADGGEKLLELPETGEATVLTQTGTIYLEARSSRLETPGGTLMLIRDVSASRVADQTIRTLFQFLQDRDEDRSRLLKRTNSAIEAERNRIARDLHDGPIQGVSAAALSLEAVRLMLGSGEHERAGQTLTHICDELSEEAMNLRRIMKDLRPPVLEQRGLVPAVRELATRAERELGIPVTVSAVHGSLAPSEVETLAYRVVQEALSNVAKHASATEVTVRVQANSGHLLVEVADDGKGFDPADAREFLRLGRVGLASMRERAELAGGTLALRSTPGSGTTVTATLPFDVLGAASAG